MKTKRLMTILLVYCSLNISAQPIFTYSAFSPSNGDLYTVGLSSVVSAGSSGANQTWDFSSSSISSTATYSVSPASTVPCSSDYPSASQAIGTNGSYDMVNISATNYQYYGTTFTPSMPGVVFTNSRQVYAYPMSYNDAFTDSYFGSKVNNSTPIYSYGNTTVTYDAYGTITTPYGTYSDVIRIHIYYTETDSTNSSVVCSRIRDYYFWYSTAYRYPVAKIWTSSTSGGCGLSEGAEFLQSVSVGIEENNNLFVEVYPNPFNSSTTIQLNNAVNNAELNIYNMFGQKVKTIINISGQEITLHKEHLPSGTYFLRLTQDDKVIVTDKLVITDI